MTTDTLMTVNDVAKRLQVTPEQVRRYIRAGTLHASRLGTGPKAKLRISDSALKEFLSK